MDRYMWASIYSYTFCFVASNVQAIQGNNAPNPSTPVSIVDQPPRQGRSMEDYVYRCGKACLGVPDEVKLLRDGPSTLRNAVFNKEVDLHMFESRKAGPRPPTKER